jgi:pimeloyl-ACP methyl ester carboxylesterase
MNRRPIVLIHGYSADETAFDTWRDKLQANGYVPSDIHVLVYQSLTNEITIDDIAEGFDRALKQQPGLDDGQEFDAIVHSTGMLVIRSWLTKFAEPRQRLRHLIALAPATFGSPLAHRGRSYFGRMVKGNREKGPDFREAGDLVLDGLELGSRFTWDLAHHDLLGDDIHYDRTTRTPYVFTFCGTDGYQGIASWANEPGTDGTVRLAGCPLNTRKIVIDLTRSSSRSSSARVMPWSNNDIPLVPIHGLDHGTIMSEPTDDLVEMVLRALAVDDPHGFDSWLSNAKKQTAAALEAASDLGQWQQLVFRVLDDRRKPVRDYVIELVAKNHHGDWMPVQELMKEPDNLSIHVYTADPSLRCFHVNLNDGALRDHEVGLKITATTGTEYVAYRAYSRAGNDLTSESADGQWRAPIDLTSLREEHREQDVRLFHPFTTTFIEIVLDREPMPADGPSKLAFFTDAEQRKAERRAREQAEEDRRRKEEQARMEELMDGMERRHGGDKDR